MILYLNLFKTIKFALVIDMNRPAPNLQLGLGTNYDVGSLRQPRTVLRNQIKDIQVLMFCNAFFGK